MPDRLVPYLDPWTTPATLWLLVIALGALLRVRGRPLAILAAGTAIGIAVWKAWSIGPPNGLLDLQIYTGSARAWVDGGSLFSYRAPVFNLSATYPPIGVLPFALLSPLSADVREVLFTCLSLGAVGLSARCVAVLAGVAPARRLEWSLWAMSLAIITVPVWLTLRQGQVNAILWLLVISDIVLIARGSRFAGVGIGVATAIKLVPGLFIIWLVVAGWRRPAARAVITTISLTALGWVLAPTDSGTYWTDQLWHSERVGRLDDARNNSLLGGLSHLLDPGPLRTAIWLALAAAILVVGMWRARRAARADDLLAGLVIVGCCSALVSPISWTHHLGYLVVAVAALLPLLSSALRRVLLAVGMLLVIDPGHLGDDLTMSMVRMAMMVLIVLALPIIEGRSSAGRRDAAEPEQVTPNDDASGTDQTDSTPRSLSTNS